MSIPNEISMLVIKSQNRARSPCKRWDTPFFIPVLCQQKVNRLPMPIYGAIEVAPLAFDLHVGLVHAPADPYRPLPAMKRFLQ